MDLFNYGFGVLEASAWTDYPKRYKFTGLEILVDFTKVIYSRQTYDTLQFFGDVGGLNEALRFLGSLAVNWFSVFNAGAFLLSRLQGQSTD